ncbi:MAG TPA: tetratricopeptide repeat protein [Rhodothermales bacterium]|nr:tetratricopeptide repeat protein [Rhodothermales bacterium]
MCAVTILVGGCVSTQNPRQIAARIQRLEQRVLADSTDQAAQRDLGKYYAQAGRFVQARTHLRAARALDSSDAQASFLLGLALEATGDTTGALHIYENYPQVPRTSLYRRRMAGRYRILVRKLTAEALREQIASGEQELPVVAGTMAVFPFTYTGGDGRYAALGRGLGEMVLVDLTAVEGLRLVERIRLQALLDELALAKGGAFDPASAPRQGRLLGAERSVGGTYGVLPGDLIRIDAAAYEGAQPLGNAETHADVIKNLFALEKDVVFGLLEEMQIELTPEERIAIEHVPTRNLQAFLAYSRGLLEEDRGNYAQALESFRSAEAMDPGFTLSADEGDIVEGTIEVTGSPQEVISRAGKPILNRNGLIGERQQKLGENVGSVMIPGQDRRTPASEAANSNTGLPDPPRPPSHDQ